MIDVMVPTTAAATPAMWPSGSMASALKLPNTRPKQKNATTRYGIRLQSGGSPEAAQAITKNTAEQPPSRPTASAESRCMP